MFRVIASRCSTRRAYPSSINDPIPYRNPNPNPTQVGIPTVAVVENMCGLQLDALQAQAGAFVTRHGLSEEAATELTLTRTRTRTRTRTLSLSLSLA